MDNNYYRPSKEQLEKITPKINSNDKIMNLLEQLKNQVDRIEKEIESLRRFNDVCK